MVLTRSSWRKQSMEQCMVPTLWFLSTCMLRIKKQVGCDITSPCQLLELKRTGMPVSWGRKGNMPASLTSAVNRVSSHAGSPDWRTVWWWRIGFDGTGQGSRKLCMEACVQTPEDKNHWCWESLMPKSGGQTLHKKGKVNWSKIRRRDSPELCA